MRNQLAAHAVHALTASGAVLGVLALLAGSRGAFTESALLMLAALALDGVDGTLARRLQAARFAPRVDGRRLDDIVDYLNYVIAPICFLYWAGHITHPALAAAPVFASAWGFAQTDAKTADHCFLGFPSYWNVLAIYLWQFEIGAVASGACLLACAALVFVPLRYTYPSRMRALWWSTNLGAALWLAALAFAVAAPARAREFYLLEISLAYPLWYLALSLVTSARHYRKTARV